MPSEDHKDDRASQLAAWEREAAETTPEEAARELDRLRREQAELIALCVRQRIKLFWLDYGALVIVLSILVVAATLIVTALVR